MIDFGINNNDFNLHYRGKAPYLKENAFNHEIYSWQELNETISRHDASSDNFKMMRGGIIPKKEYLETYREVGTIKFRAQKKALYSLLQGGAILVLNKLEGTPAYEKLRTEIARFSGCQTVSSGYAAFGNETSFGNHWDTHDVFALQLIGKKRWTIYKPTLDNPSFTHSSVGRESECPSVPFMDIILSAGDILYLPRGWWHTVSPNASPTFHLAIGIYPPYFVDYLTWLIAHRITDYPLARLRMDECTSDPKTLAKLVASIQLEIGDFKNQRSFIDTFNSTERLFSEFEIENFGQPGGGLVPEHAPLAINTFQNMDNMSEQLVINGIMLTLDQQSRGMLSIILKDSKTTIASLVRLHPNIDSSKISSLISRLVQEDILTYQRA